MNWACVEYFNGVLDHITTGFTSQYQVEAYIKAYEDSDPRVRQEAKPLDEAKEELRKWHEARRQSNLRAKLLGEKS